MFRLKRRNAFLRKHDLNFSARKKVDTHSAVNPILQTIKEKIANNMAEKLLEKSMRNYVIELVLLVTTTRHIGTNQHSE